MTDESAVSLAEKNAENASKSSSARYIPGPGGIQKTTLLKSIGSLPAVRPEANKNTITKNVQKCKQTRRGSLCRARPEASVSGFQRVRFQVWRLNSTIMGNISSLPRSISNESTTLEKVENRE